jgi:hypothetical protein
MIPEVAISVAAEGQKLPGMSTKVMKGILYSFYLKQFMYSFIHFPVVPRFLWSHIYLDTW